MPPSARAKWIVALWLTAVLVCAICSCAPQKSWNASELEYGLTVTPPGAAPQNLDLTEAMRTLRIGSVSVAVVGQHQLRWAQAFGEQATPNTRYQAASLSKLVTAVGALRLVDQDKLALDRDINDDLVIWRLPPSAAAQGHPVTLRELLSMTGGINVPGYVGYDPGQRLPNLVEILDGSPPANSPPVRIETIPGARYSYSGGGYQIVQALIESATGTTFQQAMETLVLEPLGMTSSEFAQLLPAELEPTAATGHDSQGVPVPGRWKVVPELAAGGLWSTPTDLAKLLIAIADSYRGQSTFLSRQSVDQMLTQQGVGPYGLGGAVRGAGENLVLMKRGQNVGYQSCMLIFPVQGDGIVVMSNSDNGMALAEALVRRAAVAYRWPDLGDSID